MECVLKIMVVINVVALFTNYFWFSNSFINTLILFIITQLMLVTMIWEL